MAQRDKDNAPQPLPQNNPPPAIILDHDVQNAVVSASEEQQHNHYFPAGEEDIEHPSEQLGQQDAASAEKKQNITDRSVLSRTLSTISRSSSRLRDPGPPPDAGAKAWLHVLAGHLCVVNAWGLASSFGAFQTYYSTTLTTVTPSAISWIGTFQIFLLFFVGAFSGRALDAGLVRPIMITGMLLQIIGIFTTSVCTQYWQYFLAQGVCIGLGNGLQFTPALGLVSTYFFRRRTLALAACATGGGTGGLIFPAVVRCLLPRIGFPWTIRVIGFIMLANDAIILAIMRQRLPPRKAGPLVEIGAFREKTYTAFIVGMFFNFWSLYFGFFYIGSYARDVAGLDYISSLNLLLVINGVSIIGRIAPAFLADWRFGALNTITPFVLATGLVFFTWAAVSNTRELYIWSAFYGFANAGIQGLWPATLASLTPDPKYAGVRLGMGFTLVSFATLTGSPLGGALVSQDGGQYLYAQIWGGCCMAIGLCCLVYARLASTGFVLWSRI